jgi:uncharacterized membrane protein YbaN (DUF454 family)
MTVDQRIPVATGTKRIALLGAGFLALGLAVVGAILPVMPTTPFILLAAYCFARSSTRWHNWLTTNRLFGRYVAQAAQGRPLSWQIKAVLVASCWSTAIVSAMFLAPNLPVRLTSLSMAACMTAFVLLRGRRQPKPVAVAGRSSSL